MNRIGQLFDSHDAACGRETMSAPDDPKCLVQIQRQAQGHAERLQYRWRPSEEHRGVRVTRHDASMGRGRALAWEGLMAVTNYFTMGGQVFGEKVAVGSRIDYLPDALGSVVTTVDQTATPQNTYRYKPYGSQLAKTGSGPAPKFLWNGLPGKQC